MSDLIKVVGMDPSMRHWGLAYGTYNLQTKEILITDLGLVEPTITKVKTVRQNSKDLSAAEQLYTGAVASLEGAHTVFVEVPVGSQSARAMAGYAICVGVLGAMRAEGKSFIELTPNEVKLAGFGKATATKKEMISWASKAHPEAPWPTWRGQVNEAQAEHMADAVAAIHAGVASSTFQQLLSLRQGITTRKENAHSIAAN